MIGRPATDLSHYHNLVRFKNYRAFKTIEIPTLKQGHVHTDMCSADPAIIHNRPVKS